MNILLAPEEPGLECAIQQIPISATPISSQRIKILYVEDDSALRDLGHKILERQGYDVDTAADGLEALEALRKRHYDLLITDQNMPRVKGLEMVLQARQEGLRMPVIVTSEVANSSHVTDLHGRIAAVIPKPFVASELVEKVRNTLHREKSLSPAEQALNALVKRRSEAVAIRRWGINE